VLCAIEIATEQGALAFYVWLLVLLQKYEGRLFSTWLDLNGCRKIAQDNNTCVLTVSDNETLYGALRAAHFITTFGLFLSSLSLYHKASAQRINAGEESVFADCSR
jgi:hypothetical protein